MRSATELQGFLDGILGSPSDDGTIEMLAVRPAEGERREIEASELRSDVGMVGDNWQERGSRHTEDGRANPSTQVTLMNSRVADAVAESRTRWSLAGDQIYVDLDLSESNLPAGTRLAVGEAVVEVSSIPHTGCKKFSTRFGVDALRFVNVGEGRARRFRGLNAFVVQDGEVRVGDKIRRI